MCDQKKGAWESGKEETEKAINQKKNAMGVHKKKLKAGNTKGNWMGGAPGNQRLRSKRDRR